MRSIKVTFHDGDTLTTSINGTDEEIKSYYLNKWFNFGVGAEDHMRKAVKVEFLN